MSILYSTIRTLIIDKVINAFFNNISIAFSQFDLLNGIREFDEIHIYLNSIPEPVHSSILYNAKINSIVPIDSNTVNLSISYEEVYSVIYGISGKGNVNNNQINVKIISISNKKLKLIDVSRRR